MKIKTVEDYHEYFKELFELQALSTQLKQNVLMPEETRQEVKIRIEVLTQRLRSFRDSVIVELRVKPKLLKFNEDDKKTWHCLKKSCKNKFHLVTLNYLKLIQKCPKCGTAAVELLT